LNISLQLCVIINVIKKIVREMKIGIEMLGDMKQDVFLEDEKLKRALGMTFMGKNYRRNSILYEKC